MKMISEAYPKIMKTPSSTFDVSRDVLHIDWLSTLCENNLVMSASRIWAKLLGDAIALQTPEIRLMIPDHLQDSTFFRDLHEA